jgi:glycerol-3-phosphate dehydrogenase (NAD(P)+)
VKTTNSHSATAVLGAGSWGTALALHLSRLGQTVHLWTMDAEHAATMQAQRENKRYLPNLTFPPTLHPTHHLIDAVQNVTDILIAVPSAGFRKVLTQLKPLLQPDARIYSATKGLDDKTGQLLHDVVEEIVDKKYPYAVLSGPSFAREVAIGLPTAVVIASHDAAFAQDLSDRFNSPTFRVYISSDVIGVEIGGSVKNVLAIATGISDGMGFGANARSALITRGLAEVVRLGLALGGKLETFMGLAGMGDIILTCTDNQSRNRRFGLALSKGLNASDAAREIGQVVEGQRNAELVMQLALKHHVEMPITAGVCGVLQGKLSPEQAMQELLSRTPKAEKN